MKKLILGVIGVIMMALTPSASAFDLKDALKGLAGGGGESSESTGSGQDLLGGLLGSLLSKDKLSVKDIAGEWKYNSPAVSFKSENLLMKAGGAAAASTVEGKLEPYYKTIGINGMTLTINPDSTFTMKLRRTSLSGTVSMDVSEGSQANFIFTFQMLGKINLGKMETYVTKSGKNLSVMFDITKLVAILQKIATLSGNSAVNGISGLLDQYDGICAGFKLTYTGEATAKATR